METLASPDTTSTVVPPATSAAALLEAARRRVTHDLMAAARARFAGLWDQLDPGWVQSLKPLRPAIESAARRDGRTAAAAAAKLAQAFQVRCPPMAAFRWPVHRLALLDRTQLLRVLALLAVEPRQAALRRVVGREAREQLAAALGEDAATMLLDQVAARVADAPAQPLESIGSLRPESLAEEGFRLLAGRRAWHCREALTLARLCLPPTADPADRRHSTRRTPPSMPEIDAFLRRLPAYYPELAWLFGSEADLALSVSRTASCAPPISPH
jgi:hypothetical protein